MSKKFNKTFKADSKKKHNPDNRLLEFGVGMPTISMFKKEVGLNKNFPLVKIKKLQYTKVNYFCFKKQKFYLRRRYLINQKPYKLYIKEKFSDTLHGKAKRSIKFEIIKHIEFLKKIRSYRGSRHKKNRPVRGQRTKTNGCTMRKYIKRIGATFFYKKNTHKKTKKKD